jgi:inosine/xanthosine triphosphatase
MKRETKVLVCLKANSSQFEGVHFNGRCTKGQTIPVLFASHPRSLPVSCLIYGLCVAGWAFGSAQISSSIWIALPLQSARNADRRGTLVRKIRIAVGSARRPKIAAVQEAIRDFGAALTLGTEFEVIGVEVESGVGHTPANRKELMLGARQRAEALVSLDREKAESWRYFVGLEGGLDVIETEGGRCVLLESWAYVSDGRNGHYGRSGGVEIPDALAREVLENGVELSVAIDRFAGAVGIRDAQGAWGVLSSGLISRTEAFRVAVVAAFAPFYNAKMYHAASAGG